MNRLLFFLVCFAFSVNAFETNQLPLSDKLKETFPKLSASCFIIANLDCSIIINESNSNKPIHTGTFDDIIFSSKLDLKNLGINNIEKQNNSSISNNKLTLYEMNNIFYYILSHKSFSPEIQQKNIKITIIKSAMSGYGCVFSYKHNGKYIGVLYGSNSQEGILNDVKKITSWLNQFYIQDISDKKQNSIEVPVLYGNEKKLKLTEKKQKILVSKFTSEKIERIYHYKTVVTAPIKKEEVFGSVFYSSEIFKHPIKIPLIAIKSIKKTNIFNRIFDTLYYIIFGANNIKNKDSLQNILE